MMNMDNKILNLANKIPVMLLGPPGIGKTAVVTDFAKKLSADLVDIRLSAETPSSFEGKDYISPETGTLKKARAWWLQRIDKNKSENRATVLFFDEYTNAPDALQQLAYSPFNERKLHGESFDYKLQNQNSGLYVIAAGNRVEDETGAREMVYASKTRVFTVDVEVSAKEWIKWADKNDINLDVRAFIYSNPDALIEKPSTGTACPREWANLSIALDSGIDYRKAAHGTIRGEHEAKFCTFYKNRKFCPTIAEIVAGTANPVKLVHLSGFCAVLAMALNEDENYLQHFAPVHTWIKNQSSECEVIFIKSVLEIMAGKMIVNEKFREALCDVSQRVGVRYDAF